MRVTQIGHSTVLLESGDLRLIFDPFFGRFGNPAYRRTAPPALGREACRDVDGVLISHAHFDHIDRKYLRALPPAVPVLVPHRAAWWIALTCGRTVHGVTPWREISIDGARIVPVPAHHSAPAVGYVVSVEGKTIYFAGDTYAGAFMKEIGDRFEPDVCLMPVATFRIPMTMGNRGAVEAAQLIRPRTIIPIHLGIEPRMSLLRRDEDAESFQRLAREERVPASIVPLGPGESYTW